MLNTLLKQLNELRRDRRAWQPAKLNTRLTAQVGPLTLLVDKGAQPTFQIEGDRQDIVVAWTPAPDMESALKEVCDRASAHLQTTMEPHPTDH